MPILHTKKMLAQRLCSSTDSAVLYRPTDSLMTTYINTLFICNTTNASKTYSLWVNPGGTEASDRFALYKAVSLAANTTFSINLYDMGIVLFGTNAAILCGASAANAVTFTIFGEEVVQF